MQQLSDAIFATQRALLQSITPELRAVLVDLNNYDNIFCIHFYYDGKISENALDLWQCAITEASAGLELRYTLDNHIIRIDWPNEIPRFYEEKKQKRRQETVVFWRKENISCNFQNLPFPEINSSWPLNAQGRFAVCKSLRGYVTFNLRAIVVNSSQEEFLDISFYYEHTIDPDVEIIKQIFADYWKSSLPVFFHVVLCDLPQKIPVKNGDWFAFLRKE